eukprot:m.21538 g.21538  ORF g.21538 m.21538 type:complete len:1323 (-) comp9136_c0_seq2:131-4099(-)
MTSYVKQQVARKLSVYFKDMTADKLALSVFKGTAVLQHLELQQRFLRSALLLPPWLFVKTASCNKAECKLSLSRLRSQPMVINIDRIDIVMEAVDPDDPSVHYKEEEEDPDSLQAPEETTTPSKDAAESDAKQDKYGVGDTVADGLTVNVQVIEVKIQAPDFTATCTLQDVNVESVSPEWERVSDLRHTHVIHPSKYFVTLFKKLLVGSVTISLASSSFKLPENAREVEVSVALQGSEVRITRRRSLLDNSVVLGAQLTLLLGVIKLEFTREQLQTLQVAIHSATQLASAFNQLQPPPEPNIPPQPAKSLAGEESPSSRRRAASIRAKEQHRQETEKLLSSHTLHPLYVININHILLNLRQNPGPASVRGRMLATLMAQEMEIRHVGGMRWRGVDRMAPARAPFDESFNTRRDAWLCSLGYTSELQAAQQNLNANITRIALNALSIISETGTQRPTENRASKTAPVSSPQAARRNPSESVILLQPNFSSPVKSPTSHLFLMEYTSFAIANSPATTQPFGRKSFREPPPSCVFAAVAPLKIQLHLGAMMYLVDHIEKTLLRGLNGVYGPSASLLLDSITRAPNSSELQELDATIAAASLTTLEKLQLRALCHRRMEALARTSPSQSPELMDYGNVLDKPVDYAPTHFRVDVTAPALDLPPLKDGPLNIQMRSWSIAMESICISNTSSWPGAIGPEDFRPFYQSNFFSGVGSTLKGQNSFFRPTAAASFSILPDPEELTGDRSPTYVVLRDVRLTALIDNSEQTCQLLATPIVAACVCSLQASTDKQEKESSHRDTNSFTLVHIPAPLTCCIDNEEMLYLTRVLEEFQRHSAALDSGLPASGVSSLVLEIPLIDLHLGVRAEADETLQLFADVASPRQQLLVCRAVVSRCELARLVYDRAASTTGCLQQLSISMGGLPEDIQPTVQPSAEPQLWFCMEDKLATPTEAAKFFSAWDQRARIRKLIDRYRSRHNKLVENEKKVGTEVYIQRSGMQQPVTPPTVAKSHHPSLDQQHVALAQPRQQERSSREASPPSVHAQHEENITLTNGPSQDTSQPERALSMQGTNTSPAVVEGETMCPLHNDWTTEPVYEKQDALEVANTQHSLEQQATRDASYASDMTVGLMPLPSYGKSEHFFVISGINLVTTKAHTALLSRFGYDYQEGLPAPTRTLELSHVHVMMLDETEEARLQRTMADKDTSMSSTSLMTVMDLLCSGLEVGIIQSSNGTTSIKACGPQPTSSQQTTETVLESLLSVAEESDNESKVQPQNQDHAYLEACLKSVVKEKCQLQQALEDLSTELIRLKQENADLKETMKNLSKPSVKKRS